MKYAVIVDDNLDMTMMLERFFTRFPNLKTRTFNKPKDALLYMKMQKIDIVISDIMMPGMDGIELLENIKKLSNPPQVIMITAQATLDRLLKSHRHDANDFMIKPLNLEHLEERVKSIFIR